MDIQDKNELFQMERYARSLRQMRSKPNFTNQEVQKLDNIISALRERTTWFDDFSELDSRNAASDQLAFPEYLKRIIDQLDAAIKEFKDNVFQASSSQLEYR